MEVGAGITTCRSVSAHKWRRYAWVKDNCPPGHSLSDWKLEIKPKFNWEISKQEVQFSKPGLSLQNYFNFSVFRSANMNFFVA